LERRNERRRRLVGRRRRIGRTGRLQQPSARAPLRVSQREPPVWLPQAGAAGFGAAGAGAAGLSGAACGGVSGFSGSSAI